MATEDNKKDLKKEIEKTAKLFDVAKPGKTPVSATSRPVIVGHTSMIKHDPMVKEKPTDPETGEPKNDSDNHQLHQPHNIKTIKPLSEGDPKEDKEEVASESKDEVEDNKPAPAEPEPSKETAVEDTSDEKPDEPKTEAAEPEKAEEKPEPAAPAVDEDQAKKAAVDNLVTEVSAKREAQKEKEEFDAKAKELEASIEKREFFVKIGQVSRRKSNHRIAIGLILFLILAAAAVNFGIDAEVIDIGIKPLTDLL